MGEFSNIKKNGWYFLYFFFWELILDFLAL